MRDGYISDLVSKWGVCFGVREDINLHKHITTIVIQLYIMTANKGGRT